MPKEKRARRFRPRERVVTQAAVDDEAKHIAREVADLVVLSLTDVRTYSDRRCAAARESWLALHQTIASLPERDAEAVRAVLFRDIFHAIECCRSFCRAHQPESATPIVPAPEPVERQEHFSEWLFG